MLKLWIACYLFIRWGETFDIALKDDSSTNSKADRISPTSALALCRSSGTSAKEETYQLHCEE